MNKVPDRKTAVLALLGFTLSAVNPRMARAGYGGGSDVNSTDSEGSSEGTSEESSGQSLDGTVAALSTTGGLLLVGGLITAVVVISLVHKRHHAQTDEPVGENARALLEETDEPVGENARALLVAALVTERQDLGMTASLLVQSPAALDQLELDVARGHGPGLDALTRVTGLPTAEVREQWEAAAMAAGPVLDEAAAARLVLDFIARIAPELPCSPHQATGLVWELLQERERPDFPADADAHRWVASVLGVGVEDAAAATEVAFVDLVHASYGDARAAVIADPGRYLDALSVAVEQRNCAEVDLRVQRLTSLLKSVLIEGCGAEAAERAASEAEAPSSTALPTASLPASPVTCAAVALAATPAPSPAPSSTAPPTAPLPESPAASAALAETAVIAAPSGPAPPSARPRSGPPSAGPPFESPTLGTMKFVPAGTFQMGSPSTLIGRHDDELQHPVTLTHAFYLMEREVTQAQWTAVMGSNPSHFTACGPDCPVESVTWTEAAAFAKKASARDGRSYRLPTEAEWEYAAQGGQELLYSGSAELDAVAWYSTNSATSTHPGCQKERNGYALCDMSGNVFEWVLRTYGDYLTDPAIDPLGARGGTDRVTRGGAWDTKPADTRIARRGKLDVSLSREDLGFRLAMMSP